MRTTFATVFVGLALAPMALAQDVSVDSDKSYDFSKLKTFAIQVATSSGNPLAEKRVLGEVEGALTSKGWKKVDAATADAMVMLHGATETKKDLNTMYSGMGGWRFGGMGSAQTTVQEYKVGTLIVDIFDAKSKALVFRGTAQDELSDKPDKNTKKVEKATAKMFKDFPPGSAKK
jgi:Domain of unknown function (DUF4136)